jgi:glutamyl-tRNA reductase
MPDIPIDKKSPDNEIESTGLYCLGISHQTASVALREVVQCHSMELAEALVDLAELQDAVYEWVVLSTCNRFEVYVQLDARLEAVKHNLLIWLQKARPFNLSAYQDHFYLYAEDTAANHLLRVAAGLESQVLGESQILGQVAGALANAQENETAGAYLKRLFQIVIQAGKQARTETAISQHPSSISSVAIAHIEAAQGPVAEQQILVIGAGEMAQLAINGLHKRAVNQLVIANRTREHARALVADGEARVVTLDRLPRVIAGADAVITATGAPQPIISRQLVAEVMKSRPGRPLIMVDIALPRDIEPAVGDLPGVCLVNLDELHDQLESAHQARENEVPAVEAILQEALESWQAARRELQIRPVIRQLRFKAEMIRRRELARTLKYLGEVDADTQKHVNHLSRALVNQLLHEPTIKLREQAGKGEATDLATAIQDLFNLSA